MDRRRLLLSRVRVGGVEERVGLSWRVVRGVVEARLSWVVEAEGAQWTREVVVEVVRCRLVLGARGARWVVVGAALEAVWRH